MQKKSRQSVEQLVFKLLQNGSLSGKELVDGVSFRRTGTTKQAVYRVLRKLKKEEKIVVHGKQVSLNLLWLEKMNNFFSLARFYYSSRTMTSNGFLDLGEKGKIIYYFKNLKLLDAFWSHIFYMFNKILPDGQPIFIYNPHEWFAYGQPETEKVLIDDLLNKKRQTLITVSHRTTLNLELKNKFSGDFFQYNISLTRKFPKNNYYLNIYGDYLAEAFIDPIVSKQIDDFFVKTKIFDNKAKIQLERILSQDSRHKLIISKNKNKADKYKNILKKDFYVKKPSNFKI